MKYKPDPILQMWFFGYLWPPGFFTINCMIVYLRRVCFCVCPMCLPLGRTLTDKISSWFPSHSQYFVSWVVWPQMGVNLNVTFLYLETERWFNGKPKGSVARSYAILIYSS